MRTTEARIDALAPLLSDMEAEQLEAALARLKDAQATFRIADGEFFGTLSLLENQHPS